MGVRWCRQHACTVWHAACPQVHHPDRCYRQHCKARPVQPQPSVRHPAQLQAASSPCAATLRLQRRPPPALTPARLPLNHNNSTGVWHLPGGTVPQLPALRGRHAHHVHAHQVSAARVLTCCVLQQKKGNATFWHSPLHRLPEVHSCLASLAPRVPGSVSTRIQLQPPPPLPLPSQACWPQGDAHRARALCPPRGRHLPRP